MPGSSSPHSVKPPFSVAEAVDPEEAFVGAAAAAKLRQMLPALQQALADRGLECPALRVKVSLRR